MLTPPEYSANSTAVILLAAGSSSRLGKPKQLLAYNGNTLLQHALQTALDADMHSVLVVLGAQADIIREEINNKVQVVVNTAWEEGLASSIRCGIQNLLQTNAGTEGVILMMCDQPFVTATLLNELITAHHKTGKPIVACGYDNTFGPPVFFHQSLFPELLQLKGDVGARGVIRQHPDDVEVIPFPEGTIDVDTEADYTMLQSRSRK